MTVVNVTPPVISGIAQQGETLSTSNGTWTFDQDYLTYAYQWERCDAAGANCVDIAGATNSVYVLQAADVGSTIRSEVTATEQMSPPPPTGTLLFSADNEVSDVLQQWGTSANGYPTRINTTATRGGVTPPEGSKMLFADVVPGEYAPWSSPTLQASLVQKNNIPSTQNNTDVYYGWQIYVVPGFEYLLSGPPYNGGNATFIEWHGTSGMQQAPIHFGFSAIQGQWYLDLHRAATGFSPIFTDLMGAAETGQWIQWVLRTKWSSAADGAVQLWKNGVLVADHTNLVTWNIPNVAVYPEMGIYRSSGPTPGSYFSTTGTVYFDSARIGTTREIVDPANY